MIFFDTSAFLAIEDIRDEHHTEAVHFRRGCLEASHRFLTSDYVLNESYTIIRLRTNHKIAVGFGEDVRASRLFQIQHVTREIINEAWNVFKKYSDHRFSFTDCVSFTIMKRLRIDTVFSFDSDFKAFGHFLVKP